jgi:3-oxoadipate enol-lactonase
MKTSDGRFGYEAAGDAAAPPLVFLHGIGGAARGWRGQIDYFSDRYRTIAWDMPGYGGSAPLPAVSIATLADALERFLKEVGATKPILVGHSIGGMIVQQWLTKNPDVARAVVLAQTSPAFGKADGDWQREFIGARLGPLDRGETMVSLAPTLVEDLVGDDPDVRGVELARDCMAAVPEASYRDRMLALFRFDQRDELKDIAITKLVM